MNISATSETRAGSSFAEQKSSGLGAIGGLSYGTRQQSTDQEDTAARALACSVGSLAGNVTIVAGNQYNQIGSSVVVPTDNVDIAAKSVCITEARKTLASQTEQKFKQSGISVSVSNPILDALETVPNKLHTLRVPPQPSIFRAKDYSRSISLEQTRRWTWKRI